MILKILTSLTFGLISCAKLFFGWPIYSFIPYNVNNVFQLFYMILWFSMLKLLNHTALVNLQCKLSIFSLLMRQRLQTYKWGCFWHFIFQGKNRTYLSFYLFIFYPFCDGRRMSCNTSIILISLTNCINDIIFNLYFLHACYEKHQFRFAIIDLIIVIIFFFIFLDIAQLLFSIKYFLYRLTSADFRLSFTDWFKRENKRQFRRFLWHIAIQGLDSGSV